MFPLSGRLSDSLFTKEALCQLFKKHKYQELDVNLQLLMKKKRTKMMHSFPVQVQLQDGYQVAIS